MDTQYTSERDLLFEEAREHFDGEEIEQMQLTAMREHKRRLLEPRLREYFEREAERECDEINRWRI